jgi:DNA-binding GntR family transcriptional regulator
MPSRRAGNPKTRNDLADDRLRFDILSGHLHPGQRLRLGDLYKEYGASVGVLREALARLARARPGAVGTPEGLPVTPNSRSDLIPLTVRRREKECLTLRHARAQGDL